MGKADYLFRLNTYCRVLACCYVVAKVYKVLYTSTTESHNYTPLLLAHKPPTPAHLAEVPA